LECDVRIPRSITILTTVLVLALVLAAAYMVSRPTRPLIAQAEIGLSTITPNADGETDATLIRYRIRREATVSIYFEDSAGDRYTFRSDQIRTRGRYEVLFSGIVEGFTQEGESVQGEVLERLLPDGEYTWVVEAVDRASGQADQANGTLTIEDGDPALPDLWEFTISPEVFTPNQDGLNDRTWINVYVSKPATLLVYLLSDEGEQIFVPEVQEADAPGEAGRHSFEYDGGVDLGRDPPPNGTYAVRVEASDDEGQRVSRSGQLTITNGGIPFAEIVAQPVGDTVQFSSETVVVGDVLTFKLTVWNYGDAPIRTTGPEPGYIYDQSDVYSSSGFYDESGAWRVGIHCDTCLTDYPWRWAVGSQQDLTPIESSGQTHYYLMPGQRAVITGGVRLTNIIESRNPQQFWAGLIHEDVGITSNNNRVDPHWIEIVEQAEPTD
jgi:hypothetical protein